ncbi:putative C-_U-editing enzyme APOBEC-4 [Tiliqua scincoides]|uniref:putative C->U-editing enzyme APOBEC-4 n=1 Tax=Tiliqua scincoides TaxID=71010 RepID=UPI0034627CAD
MTIERESFCQEYLAHKGTIVKPYYWLMMSQSCTKCPYHIRTGEEARVPYVEFNKAFGFPYGQMRHKNNHLLFYELRHFSGKLIQKGHATNCTKYNIHPESMLFEMAGYLDSVVHTCENAAHIIIYSNYSPCNEAEHGCISKIYNFLTKYPDITLCLYFSQLYHTEEDFPVSTWNCEALQSLASMRPQVTLRPVCGGLWHSVLSNFVTTMPQTTFYHPLLPARALADRQNAQQINSITRMIFPFMNTLPQPTYRNPMAVPNLLKYYMPRSHAQQPTHMGSGGFPPLKMPPPHPTIPINVPSPFEGQLLYPKPKNIVRHLKIPDESLRKVKPLQIIPHGRYVRGERFTEQLSNSKSTEYRDQRTEKGFNSPHLKI